MSMRVNRLAALLAVFSALALLIGAGSASANNDPHRFGLVAAPFDLPSSFCGFPVHGEFPVAKEEAKVSEGADGSTIIKITGSLEEAVTNVETGKTITFNASGPGTVTISPDGTTVTQDSEGVSALYAPNLTQFGFPSNFVQISGPLLDTYDLASGAIISMPTRPHVTIDVCAALSS